MMAERRKEEREEATEAKLRSSTQRARRQLEPTRRACGSLTPLAQRLDTHSQCTVSHTSKDMRVHKYVAFPVLLRV